jgi:hypothetical protein
MKYIAIASVLIVALSCMSCKNGTDLKQSEQTEKQDSLPTAKDETVAEKQDSTVTKKSGITAEMALKGVDNYCHKEYDWSVAKENPSMMYVQMGEETETEYKVVFRSYTGSFVYFFVDKATGKTRMVEHVPSLNIEEESGTIELLEYLK